MITYLLLTAHARMDIYDLDGKLPVDSARANGHAITEQVANLAMQGKLEEEVPNDIQLFLETFGYVERLDFLQDLRNISRHMSNSLNLVTDELTSAGESTTDFDLTDNVTDDQLSDAHVGRSRHHSNSHDQ